MIKISGRNKWVAILVSVIALVASMFCLRQKQLDLRLFAAIQANNFIGVEDALRSGANPNSFGSHRPTTIAESIRALRPSGVHYMYEDALHIAIRTRQFDKPRHRYFDGDPNIVKTLVEHGASLNGVDSVGDTPLLAAVCTSDNRDHVRILLEHGANPNCWNTNSRSTPLLAAAIMGDVTMAEMLLAHGADPNAHDHSGQTALMEASFAWRADSWSVRGATAKYRHAMVLQRQNMINIVRLLLDHGADVSLKDVDGKSAIDIAARALPDSTLLDLLQKPERKR